MKTRRIAIVAFMLATVLTLGIGYAALTGTLMVDSSATFYGSSFAQSELMTAVQFTDATTSSKNCDVAIDANDNHLASFRVTFTDVNGTDGQTFTASATFTITYVAEENYPDMKVEIPAVNGLGDTEGWTVTTDWTAAKVLSYDANGVNNTATVTITVQYYVEDSAAVADLEVVEGFDVSLSFSPVV